MIDIATSLIGTSNVQAGQIDAFVRSVNPGAPLLGSYYAQFGQLFGLRHDIAAAQMVLETGYLQFGGNVLPEWRNPAGINDAGGRGFQHFATWEQGVHAHFERLQSYVRPYDVTGGEGGKYDKNYGHWRYQQLIDTYGQADRIFNVATLWQTGDPLGYAMSIVSLANGIAATQSTPIISPPAVEPATTSITIALVAAAGITGLGYLFYRIRKQKKT